MKRFLTLAFGILSMCLAAYSQTPTYLTKTYKPTEQVGYEVKPSVGIQGGETWKNAFTICDRGKATFNVDGKHEQLSFIIGPVDYQLFNESSIVTILADGRKIFDAVVKPADLPRHITLNISGVNTLQFVEVKNALNIAFCEVALWDKDEIPHDLQSKAEPNAQKKLLFKDIKPYHMNGTTELNNNGHKWVTPDRKTTSIKIGNKTWDYGLAMDLSMQLIGNGAKETHLNIKGQYETLQFTVGPLATDNAKNGRGWITVLGDNKILYEYEIEQDHIARHVTLNIEGVHKLTFASEQTDGSQGAGIVDAWVFPKGQGPVETSQETTEVIDPKLKTLPDVCKLISNIPPYSLRSGVEQQLYDGKSDYITFSMGGVKFSEGFILYNKANVLSNDVHSHAIFDLGNEFDYISFTVGYVSKSWAMSNDQLSVFADDKLIFQTPLQPTFPNQTFVVPIKKCRKLKFESKGQGTLDVAAYGVADLVVYRGDPVENELFVHPTPECPSEIDLIDLGAPYLHYVSSAESGVFVNGKSQKDYFTRYDNSRIYKGFILQTSTHFSLDQGVLAGSDAVGAATIGAAAIGAAFVPIGVSVGGAIVGTSLMSVAGLMMLAAGGEAIENSCAAFNTYGEYNSVTFTVECLRTQGDTQFFGTDTAQPDISERKEKLLIGADHTVMAELAIFEGMEPQTVTVPINGCGQLMFWLANTKGTSAAYVFHDIKVSKEKCELIVPEDMRPSEAVVTEPRWTEQTIPEGWTKPNSCGVSAIDSYLVGLRNLYDNASKAIKKYAPSYTIHTYYLETEAMQICKAVKLISKVPTSTGEHNAIRIPYTLEQYGYTIKSLREMKEEIVSLSLKQASAVAALPELGLGALSYGKVLKECNKLLKLLKEAVNEMHQCTIENEAFLKKLISTAIDIDGRESNEKTIFAPLLSGEETPNGTKSKVRNFAE